MSKLVCMCETPSQKSDPTGPLFSKAGKHIIAGLRSLKGGCSTSKPKRFIALDIHKHYFVAAGVDRQQNSVFGPRRATWERFDRWVEHNLNDRDSVVIEMTTNTWEVYDTLLPRVQSVIVVHPPHVKAVTEARVMTDKIAAFTLAKLLAANWLKGIWVPPPEVRELRALVAQRMKMMRLSTKAKNRLHATLHRRHLVPPEGFALFSPELRPWWEALKVPSLEKVRILSDLATLEFSQNQISLLENSLAVAAAEDERIPLLVQVPGIGMLSAITIVAAIGEISRFPEARKLVGYAGLGSRVHDSGQRRTTGGIPKSGRKDLRRAMVDAANHAVRSSAHWKAQFKRLEPRLGRSRAIVAIARKLLVVVWHLLTDEKADRFSEPEQVARLLFSHAYRVGVKNLPGGQSALEFTRDQLDRLGIGEQITELPWGRKRFKLPPSKLPPESQATG